MSNEEYLSRFLKSDPELPKSVLLPHESQAVDEAVNKQKQAYQEVIAQKIEVSGGDDWHDGAFRATDNEAKIIGQQMAALAPFIGGTVIEYPDITEKRASIGSRLMIVQNDMEYPVDIVGFRSGYPEDVIEETTGEFIVGMSPESPLAAVLMGSVAGSELSFNNAGRDMTVVVNKVDQIAVKSHFAQHIQPGITE